MWQNLWWKLWIIDYRRHNLDSTYYFTANDQADKKFESDAGTSARNGELKEKYSSKDQKTQQKLQQETMASFPKHGVNPLAGCFPINSNANFNWFLPCHYHEQEKSQTQLFMV